jgi:hypothetical protein
MTHSFHIPVLGLAYSIDTPLKVARFGISSVVSIVDDELIERMRKYHLEKNNQDYTAIEKSDHDFRAKRITAYLNLLNTLVEKQVIELRSQDFEGDSDLNRYFELLPDHSELKKKHVIMQDESRLLEKEVLQKELKAQLKPGAIEVNIMAKVDKMNFAKNGSSLGDNFTDALSALRGYAQSDLSSSIILSAGMNPRLYSYLTEFEDFFPKGLAPKKKVILKVSDFRSAFIQAKFLAKKGIWIHEFRVESGLNCGGHAFATEGYLLGPILQEFKERRTEMITELYNLYKAALKERGSLISERPITRITVQGGIGNSEENNFLQQHYQLDGTGWGSPFLLVPEATNVDEDTLKSLRSADASDFYVSGASPLGIPFNDFRKSTSEQQRLDRIAKGRPGSPCTKKYLVSNTEFTEVPICTASRKYQNLKIKELKTKEVSKEEYDFQFEKIVEKACLCEGLTASVYIKNDMLKAKESNAVSICPGPNTAYFSNSYTLEEMVKHIYGKINLLEGVKRPHMYINELKLYIDYFRKDVESSINEINVKNTKRLERFKDQLLKGIDYYQNLLPELKKQKNIVYQKMENELQEFQLLLNNISIPSLLIEKDI